MDKDVQDYLVNKIRSEYEEKRNKDLDALLALDKKIKLPPLITAYTIGIIGALIFGFGMSLVVTNFLSISSYIFLGSVIGVFGMAIIALNYPLYKYFLEVRKEKYKYEIIRLADKISN